MIKLLKSMKTCRMWQSNKLESRNRLFFLFYLLHYVYMFDIFYILNIGGFRMNKIERSVGVVYLAEELGVSIATIGNYCKKGMPYSESYNGIKKVKVFNVDECKQWQKSRREGK